VTAAIDVASRRRARERRHADLAHDSPDTGPDPTLDPLDELDVALYAVGDVGQWIQNADTKSGMLGALLGLVVAGVTSQLDAVGGTLGPGPERVPAAVLLSVFAVSLLVAGACLGLTQLPRLTVAPTVRRLAFPALARRASPGRRPALAGRRRALAGRRRVRTGPAAAALPPAGAEQLRDEAWCQAETLARIALRKFWYLRVGLVASGLCVLAFLTWLGLAATVPH